MYNNALTKVVEEGGKILVEGGVLSGAGYESGCYVKPAIAEAKNSFEQMQQIYLTQNLDNLYTFMKKESDSPIANSRVFLENRNQNWIPQMEKMMESKSVFFAVGAAHLAGPEGVIELLIKKGFTLTPIKL
jgi:uncharacterized protein YbaP (TraB family)